MSVQRNLEQQLDELVEQHLNFLRGHGPEPDLGHLSSARRRAALARLEIVDTLFGLDPQLPALEDDPVAIQLGLVSGPGPESSGGGSGNAATSDAAATGISGRPGASSPGAVSVRRVLNALEADFAGQVSIDWQPSWLQWPRLSSDGEQALPLIPLAQCSVLGDSISIFIREPGIDEPLDESVGPLKSGDPDLADSLDMTIARLAPAGPSAVVAPREAEALALFLRVNPDVSSIGLVSHDGARAAIVPAAACHRSIDPVRGWLEPGTFIMRDELSLIMSRYFEQRVPRWDRVAGLAEVVTFGDDSAATHLLVQQQRDDLLKTRPRLEHKKYGQQILSEVDPDAVSTLIAAVQGDEITEGDFVQRIEALAVDSS